jgi:hypothetical protein
MFNGQNNLRIGGGAGASSMHPVVLIWLLIAILLIFVLPRKYVIVPILVTLFLTPFGQQVYIAGAHMFLSRFLILSGWIRLRKDKAQLRGGAQRFNAIERVFICWAICRAAATFLEFLQVQAVVTELGFLLDSLGGFFLFRSLIRTEEDVARVIKVFAWIVSIMGVTMAYEHVRDLNVFGFIGAPLIPMVREGAIRAQATFETPIAAGTFGATSSCLFLWLWRSRRATKLAIAALLGSVLMVFGSASSTPVMGLFAGIFAVSFWGLRRHTRAMRWGLGILLVLLHLVMKAPVWMLINHVTVVGGNSAYHRAMLIDQFVRHFGDWWLIGIQSTRDWGWDMWDQANQFVWEGESGGLITFICFILLVSWSFGRLGTARKRSRGEPTAEWLLWFLGCSLFAYVVAFFGISLSDQLVWSWYVLLAMICAATASDFAQKASIGADRTTRPVESQSAYLDEALNAEAQRLSLASKSGGARTICLTTAISSLCCH